MKNFTLKGIFLKKSLLLLFAATITACKKDKNPMVEPPTLPVSGPDQVFYALSNNNLHKFNAKAVGLPEPHTRY